MMWLRRSKHNQNDELIEAHESVIDADEVVLPPDPVDPITDVSINQRRNRLDDGTLFWGFIMGVGAGIAFLLPRLPQRAIQLRGTLTPSSVDVRGRLASVDPVQASLQTGREIARQQARERDADAADETPQISAQEPPAQGR